VASFGLFFYACGKKRIEELGGRRDQWAGKKEFPGESVDK